MFYFLNELLLNYTFTHIHTLKTYLVHDLLPNVAVYYSASLIFAYLFYNLQVGIQISIMIVSLFLILFFECD